MGKEKTAKKFTIQQRQILWFAAIILCFMVVTSFLHIRTLNKVYEMTVDQMRSQAGMYQDSLEVEVMHAISQQIDFFHDRNLAFLAEEGLGISDYEKRDALLSIQEKLGNIAGVSNIIENCTVYMPKIEYKVTQGAIRRMSVQDTEDMETYLQAGKDGITYEGDQIYLVETGTYGSLEEETPNFVFVMFFSKAHIEDKLTMLDISSEGGAFIYHQLSGAMVESKDSPCPAQQIVDFLEKEKEEHSGIQGLRVNGKRYLVFVGGEGSLGSFIQYTSANSVLGYIYQSWVVLVVCLLVLVGLAVSFVMYTNRMIHKPIKLLLDAFEKLEKGDMDSYIYRNTEDEFTYLFNGYNNMLKKLKELIDEVFIQKNLAQRAQLKQLQAQINPHFLYNSFFILGRRIKRQDYENAEEFAKHLGNYFRYLTRNGADDIPLVQEVSHAKSYAVIQAVRFSDRLQVEFGELPKKYENIMVPRLILQPLLENCFEHGLENRIKDGLLRVSFVEETSKICIMVEDNGEELTEERLTQMQQKMKETDSDEVTGIVNIHKRLQFYFDKRAGLEIARSPLGGIAATIWIDKGYETGGKKDV